MKRDIYFLALYLKNRCGVKLPESITLESEGVESATGYCENQITWLPKTNQLIKVKERFWEIISSVSEPLGGILVPPEEEQKEQILGDMEGKDWLRFGPIIISKLQETVHESQQKSPQKPK